MADRALLTPEMTLLTALDTADAIELTELMMLLVALCVVETMLLHVEDHALFIALAAALMAETMALAMD